MLNQNLYAVVLAGGSGTRFWPRSRMRKPKQLCAIVDKKKTMLEMTLDRLDGLVQPGQRIIVTHQEQAELTAKIASPFDVKVLAEPMARNTGAALVMAALEIHHMQPDAVMMSLHADHSVKKDAVFKKTMAMAAKVAAEQERIVLVGIQPDHAETAYGYIEMGPALKGYKNTCRVKSFREKPDKKTAKKYVNSGKFLWNAGLFAWKVSSVLVEMETHLPKTFQSLKNLLEQYKSFQNVPPAELEKAYESFESISIDHAIFEKSPNILVLQADLGWQDIGSWDALPQSLGVNKDGNYISGEIVALDCQDSVFDTDGPLIAVMGMENVVVVASEGAILVCPKDRVQDVKLIVEKLKGRRPDLL